MSLNPPPLPDPNRGLIIAGWICVGIAVLTSTVPLLNFLALIFGGALLTASFVMSIILLARGINGQGLTMLLVSILGAPVAMAILFLLSNFIFAAVLGSQMEGLERFPTPPQLPNLPSR